MRPVEDLATLCTHVVHEAPVRTPGDLQHPLILIFLSAYQNRSSVAGVCTPRSSRRQDALASVCVTLSGQCALRCVRDGCERRRAFKAQRDGMALGRRTHCRRATAIMPDYLFGDLLLIIRCAALVRRGGFCMA